MEHLNYIYNKSELHIISLRKKYIIEKEYDLLFLDFHIYYIGLIELVKPKVVHIYIDSFDLWK